MARRDDGLPTLPAQDQLWRDMGFGRTKLRIVYLTMLVLAVANVAQGIDRYFLARNAQVQAFVVVTDTAGQTAQVQRADARWEPGDGVWINQAIRWVHDVRARPADPDTAQWQATQIRHATVRDLWPAINAWMVRTRDELRGQAVEFELKEATMVHKQARSAGVFVRWRERKRVANATGAWTDFAATISLALQPPTTPKQIADNPLGIYVTDYSFVEERR